MLFSWVFGGVSVKKVDSGLSSNRYFLCMPQKGGGGGGYKVETDVGCVVNIRIFMSEEHECKSRRNTEKKNSFHFTFVFSLEIYGST